MTRPLTDSEREAMETPLREYWIQKDGLLPKETRAFEAGFIAGLDFSAALQADNAKLRAALKPFAEYATTLTNWDSDPVIVARWRGVIVTAGDFRKVATALGEPPST